MKTLLAFLVSSVVLWVHGQPLDSLLKSIEQNNPQLVTMQKWLEAEAVYARTGIHPVNPQVRYAYLYGNPVETGNLQELEILQSFRLPGYYNKKAALQQLHYEQKQLWAGKEMREIMHQVRVVYFNLVWLHRKDVLLQSRREEAERLLAMMKLGFERGEISKPAYDKARIFYLNVQAEWNRTSADIQIMKGQLQQLNGGNSIDHYGFEYPADWLIPPLDSVLSQTIRMNPDLQSDRLEIEISENSEKFERANIWPTFEAGYKSETILNQKLQGFQFGLTIPFWQEANKLKYSRLQQEWSQAQYEQREAELKVQVASLYSGVQSLQDQYLQMKETMEDEQISEMNLDLLETGQISFTEYFVDSEFIWEVLNNFFAVENAYFVGLSKLKSII
jgi:outer membrane protein, heavy metal efflux system